MTAFATPQAADPIWLKTYPAGLDWRAEIPVRPATDLLDETVRAYGDRPFLDFLGKKYRYREIAGLVDRFATGLQRIGLRKGDKVGLFLPNTPYYVIAYFGILRAGGIVVNFNPLYADREVKHQIDDAQAKIMVTLDLDVVLGKLQRMLGQTVLEKIIVCPMAHVLPFPKNLLFPLVKRKELGSVPNDGRHLSFKDIIANDGKPAKVAIDPGEDVAVLQYTGGTTGLPKGAMLTHANIYANTVQCTDWFPGARLGEERMLGVLPFFHVFAMTAVMNLSIRLGAEIIMLPRFELDTVMETIAGKKPTLFPAVPTIYTAILNHPKCAQYDLSSIRMCLSGGAPLPVETKNAFEKNTGCRLVEGYGLSEASPVTNCNPIDGVNKTGSIGLPLPGTSVEIVSLEDGVTVLPPGERGELCVRGPQVMKGYWNKPEETERTLRNGRLHTGDVAYMDEDGYVFIVDRIKDMILCSGYNVYPRNVEEAILQHPSVAEVIVGGIPDEYRGQTVKAWVRLKEGAALTQNELIAFLEDRLSKIEQPKFVEFRSELPKTLIGKLDRKALLQEEAAKSGKA
ncbi:MAG TPA: long-chain fatty acid--CoA ligase [Azospirillaceae bacterium]|nr:long-chain fatty acid--CoA ligase [Azospirillaceae bacterium]